MDKSFYKRRLFILYSIVFFLIIYFLFWALSGRTCILSADGYNQYFPVYVYVGKYVRGIIRSMFSGHLIVNQYDFGIGLGEEIIPTLNYYGFGNPIYLLSVLIPAKYSEFGYNLIIVIQFYLGGLAFIKYALKKQCSEWSILATVFFYLFNMYTLNYGIAYPPYLTVLITIPLLCYGIEKSIDEKKFNLVIILIMAMQSLSGFYHLYMLGIFGGFYTLLYAIKNSQNINEYLGKVFRVYAGFILGMMLAGIVLCPSMIGFFHSSRLSQKTLMESLQELWQMQRQVIGDVYSSYILPGTRDKVETSLYCCLFMLVPIVTCWKKIKDMPLKVMCVIFTVLYIFTPFTSYVFGGFPDHVYLDRWLFIYIFVICAVASKGIDRISEVSAKTIVINLVAFIAYVVSICLIGEVTITEYLRGNWKMFLVLTIGFILWFACRLVNINRDRQLAAFMNIIQIVFVIIYIFVTAGNFGNYKTIGNPWDEVQNSATQVYGRNEGEFKRVDIKSKCINQSTIQGYYGIQEYYSIMNSAKINFFVNYGLSQHPVSYRVYDLQGFHNLQDLLSVEYYQDIEDPNLIVYNEDAYPLGVTFDSLVSQEIGDNYEIWERIVYAKDTLILDKEDIVPTQDIGTHIPMTNVFVGDDKVTGSLYSDHDTTLFLQIPYSQGWKAYVNGIEKPIYIADYGFMAIDISIGDNQIEFIYHTPGLAIGILLSFISLILICFIMYNNKKNA